MFSATVRSWGKKGKKISDSPKMLFFFWWGLLKLYTAHFGSSVVLKCKQRTSSDWPLWTEPAAPHVDPRACGSQCRLSLTHDCEGLRLNGLTAQKRLLEELGWRAQCVIRVCVIGVKHIVGIWAWMSTRSGYHAVWGLLYCKMTQHNTGSLLEYFWFLVMQSFFSGKKTKTLNSWS